MLGYLLLTFTAGVATSGAIVLIAARWPRRLIQRFAFLYASVTVLVAGRLAGDYARALASPDWQAASDYAQSMIGFYGLACMMPLLARTLAGCSNASKERIWIVIVCTAFVGQHVTEYWAPKSVDELADAIENILMIVIVVYTLAFTMRHRNPDPRVGFVQRRFLLAGTLCCPGIVYDLFLAPDAGFSFFPLTYATLSLIVVHALIVAPSVNRPAWWRGLTEREQQIAQLVARGLHNRQIGVALHISPNTVKTHLKNMYEKTGIASRFALIAELCDQGIDRRLSADAEPVCIESTIERS